MTRPMRFHALLALGAVTSHTHGCVTDEGININLPPVANAGPNQQHAYDGSDVAVELDGSESSDQEGEIVRYQWQSGGVTPTATGGVTAGDLPDPDDEARPTLRLGEGVWLFNLWVTDDAGSVSSPDQVEIVIGEDPAGTCLTAPPTRVPMACRECVCDMRDECRSAFVTCDDACWERIVCIRQQCPSGTPSDPDEACVNEHCSADATARELLDAVLVDTCVASCPAEALCYAAALPQPEPETDGGVDADAGP